MNQQEDRLEAGSAEENLEEFNSDDFFANDFLVESGDAQPGDEEVGVGLDHSGQTYLSGGARLKRQALRWLSRGDRSD